jgi:PAS domain S-box-containing protein
MEKVASRAESLLAQSPVTLYACGLDGVYDITFISNGVADLLGYTAEEVMSFPNFWVNNLHPDDRNQVVAEMLKVVSGETLLRKFRFRQKNGDWKWIRDRPRLILDASGNPFEIIGAWTDVTDLIKSEFELESIAHHLQAVLDNVADAIITTDEYGIVSSINHAAEKLFGYTETEIINHHVDLVVAKSHRNQHDIYLQRCHFTGVPYKHNFELESMALRKDGSEFETNIVTHHNLCQQLQYVLDPLIFDQ